MSAYTIYLNREPVRDWLNDTIADLEHQSEKDGKSERISHAAQRCVWIGFPAAVGAALKARFPDDEFSVRYRRGEGVDQVTTDSGDGDGDRILSALDEARLEAFQAGWFSDEDIESADAS